MQWSETASLGTKKGNERPIHLKGTYNIQWNTYSELDESNSGKFFVLINKIEQYFIKQICNVGYIIS